MACSFRYLLILSIVEPDMPCVMLPRDANSFDLLVLLLDFLSICLWVGIQPRLTILEGIQNLLLLLSRSSWQAVRQCCGITRFAASRRQSRSKLTFFEACGPVLGKRNAFTNSWFLPYNRIIHVNTSQHLSPRGEKHHKATSILINIANPFWKISTS